MNTNIRRHLALLLLPAALDLQAAHPLDPLSTNEIRTAIDVLRAENKVGAQVVFPLVALNEPAKADVLAWRPGAKLPREAHVTAYDMSRHLTHDAVVNLDDRRVSQWRLRPGAQPAMTSAEYEVGSRLLGTNELWVAALHRRGIQDLSLVDHGAVPAGVLPVPGDSHQVRLFRAVPFHKGATRATWEPIEGLMAIVDMTHQKVLQVLDQGVSPRSKDSLDIYDPAVRGTSPALKPLVVSQPEGPSFTVADHTVSWDRWRFRYSLHPREGLVLHQVAWEESPGRLRPVLYRASLAELFVPYGDPDDVWAWRAYLDEGNFGIGGNVGSLKRGSTTPAYATLMDEVLPNGVGGAGVVTNSVDLYERDSGILWAHRDDSAGTIGPRARELVIGCLSSIGNYDYRFQWSFRQDGSIEFHVYLTGIMQLKGTTAGTCSACAALASRPGTVTGEGEQRHGVLVADHTLAPHHQHFFNVRLDLDVDGTRNAVKEMNVSSDRTGRSNPHGSAFSLSQTVFAREREAVRDLNPQSNRMWVVFNPSSVSQLGHAAGYLLDPGMNTVPFMARDSSIRRRAGFVDHHFYATRYRASERYAAGDFPVSTGPPDDLVTWARDNERIMNEDVVVWYTMGLTHVARPEDFPVMPTAHLSFRLAPKAFFPKNPALAVPDAPAAIAGGSAAP
jgi:primary-amine oxidase